MSNSIHLRRALGAIAVLALAACSDATSPDAQLVPAAVNAGKGRKPAPTPPPDTTGTTPPPPTTYVVATCAGGTLSLSANEKATLDLHNTQRTSSGLPTFCVEPTLTTAARSHSDEMLAKQYFSHNSFNGDAFDVRLRSFGYTGYTSLAENIGLGSGSLGTPSAMFSSWMNSAGHRANILDGTLRQIGIGVSTGTYQGVPGVIVYTVDFGTR